MYKNAIEKIEKFYNLEFNNNFYTNDIFQILQEIVDFNSGGIFYVSAEKLTYEYGIGNIIYSDKKPDKKGLELIFDKSKDIIPLIRELFNIQSEVLVQRLIIKDSIFGLLIIERNNTFSDEEQIIFKTCSAIISKIIRDMEITKVLKIQSQILQEGMIDTNNAYIQLEKQNKKIKQEEKLQNEFIANISHDLRTPLNSIIGFSELLSSNIFGELNEKQKEYIEDIRLAGIKLLSMINEILDITKIESRTITLNQSVIDFNILINEICNIIKPLTDKKNIKIIRNIENNVSYNGDYIKMQQVIMNILSNAIKFSPQNSDIILSIEKEGNKILIKIKDNGIGIEKKYHKKIFNKFFQVENQMSKSEVSTGLGLTVSKEFIKLHGGDIRVESTPQKGSTFIVELVQK